MPLPTANVLDLSHHNDPRVPDFGRLMREYGVLAFILKASQGLHYEDATFQDRWRAIQAAGGLVGAYHFLDASDADGQAEHFLSVTQACRDAGVPLMMAADYEENPPRQGGQAGLHQLQTFMAHVDSAANVSTVVYSSNLIRETLTPHPGGQQHPDMSGAADFFQRHRLWLAEYGPHENIPWPWNAPVGTEPAPGAWLWQFADHGRFGAVLNGQVDCNYYAGTRDQLAARWAS